MTPLGLDEVKFWLQQDLEASDKILVILSSFKSPVAVKDIGERSINAGFKIPRSWNISTILRRTKGLAIRVPAGWELTPSGAQRLSNVGVLQVASNAVRSASKLRSELQNIKNANTKAFVEEAIKCLEGELNRSSIVMSWIAAVDTLYAFVLANHVVSFNAEASRVDQKWKPAVTADDLAKMKEADFLDRLVAISVLGKSVKAELKSCLDRRNGCGHPNSLKIGENTAAHHIEILVLNVFKVF